MSEIFLWCLLPKQGPFLCKHIPIRLASVCKYWRNTAHSTPTLWISLSVKWDGNLDKVLQIAERWFSFAGKRRSLRLTIEYEKGTVTRIIYESRSKLSATPFKPPRLWTRLRRLALVANNGMMISELLDFLRISLTGIVQLNLHYKPDTNSGLASFPPFELPNLAKLVMGSYTPGIRERYDGSFNDISWSRLTILNLLEMPITGAEWRRLIERSRDTLKHGTLLIGTDNTPVDIQAEATTLPSILSFSVYFEESSDYTLLRDPALPRLNMLALGWLSGLGRLDAEALNNMRIDQLASLTPVNVEITEEDLVAFLVTTPHIHALVFDIPMYYTPFFQRLKDVELEVLLPRLADLELYQWQSKSERILSQLDAEIELNFDIDAFVQVIEARWIPGSQSTASSLQHSLRIVKIGATKPVSCRTRYHRSVMRKALREGCNIMTLIGTEGYYIAPDNLGIPSSTPMSRVTYWSVDGLKVSLNPCEW